MRFATELIYLLQPPIYNSTKLLVDCDMMHLLVQFLVSEWIHRRRRKGTDNRPHTKSGRRAVTPERGTACPQHSSNAILTACRVPIHCCSLYKRKQLCVKPVISSLLSRWRIIRRINHRYLRLRPLQWSVTWNWLPKFQVTLQLLHPKTLELQASNEEEPNKKSIQEEDKIVYPSNYCSSGIQHYTGATPKHTYTIPT